MLRYAETFERFHAPGFKPDGLTPEWALTRRHALGNTPIPSIIAGDYHTLTKEQATDFWNACESRGQKRLALFSPAVMCDVAYGLVADPVLKMTLASLYAYGCEPQRLKGQGSVMLAAMTEMLDASPRDIPASSVQDREVLAQELAGVVAGLYRSSLLTFSRYETGKAYVMCFKLYGKLMALSGSMASTSGNIRQLLILMLDRIQGIRSAA